MRDIAGYVKIPCLLFNHKYVPECKQMKMTVLLTETVFGFVYSKYVLVFSYITT